jgi:Flp pilus assembly protein TadD
MRAAYLELTNDNPYLASAHLGLGRAELLNGMAEKARDSFRKALSLDKSCAEAHMGLADALRQTGDRDGAILSYREVLKVDGRNTRALWELGTTYKMVQKRELAIFHLEKLIETAPADSHYAGLARKLLNENRGMLIN